MRSVALLLTIGILAADGAGAAAQVSASSRAPASDSAATALPPAQRAPAQAPLSAEAQARSDSLARAALAATKARRRVFVDVRTPEEFTAGHLPGAINLPLTDLERSWPQLQPYSRRQIVLYCRSGHRAGLALDVLKRHGFEHAVNGGGYEALRQRLPTPR